MSTPQSFDVLAPGYFMQGNGEPALYYAVNPGTALTATRDAASAEKDTVVGLLALQHHNASGVRATLDDFAPSANP